MQIEHKPVAKKRIFGARCQFPPDQSSAHKDRYLQGSWNIMDVNAYDVSRRWQLIIQTMILCALALVFYLYSFQSQKLLWQYLKLAGSQPWHKLILRPSLVWAYMGLGLLALRTLLWFTYRPYRSADVQSAPRLTVVIPAYNEGPMVAKSIESVAAARYPKERLEIFVVDDGSKDDTWEHIVQASARYPELVTAVRFAKNQGKRAALAEGFRKAKGEIVVTIDSDSVIDEGTLLAIVAPFANPRVGAVAGRVKVYNQRDGLIPRMLNVRFALSFDFLRAAQSTYGTVYCCPGALAAYRLSVVRQVLDRWMSQTFLGSKCTFGEDRAMTNDILAMGYDSVYQRSAIVHTIVPVTYEKLCKMYLRWDRSYVREELRLGVISLGRPLPSRLITLIDIMTTNSAYVLGYFSLALLVYFCLSDLSIMERIIIAIGLTAGVNTLYYLKMERSWNFVYGVIYAYYSFFLMFWILPYAALTVRSKSWMTR
jgi:hyaluronan synthase